jgi:hypothetical protein
MGGQTVISLNRVATLPAYAIVALQRARDVTTKISQLHVTYTVVEAIAHEPFHTTAPNGSSEGIEYRTSIIVRQDWAAVPENGIYAGRSYRVEDVYHSSYDDGTGTMFLYSSARPWCEPAAEIAL